MRNLLLLGLLMLGAPAWADVVELKTGQRVEGTLTQVTPDTVVIEADGQPQRFERARIRAIYLESPATPARSASPARAAVEALKAVGAATKSPEAFKGYQARLAEAKGAVDRYLRSDEPGERPLQEAVKAALHYFELASSGLAPYMTDAQFAAVGQDPALDRCPQLRDVLAATQKMSPKTFAGAESARNRGLTITMFGLGAVWACAGDRVIEAERFLDKQP